jgi:hypothetical protein
MTPPNLPGAEKVVQWCGDWTHFHDFYMLNLPDAGATDADIRIHGWIVDSTQVDDQGCWLQRDDCAITLQLRGIRRTEVLNPDGVEPPIMIMSLELKEVGDAWLVAWDSSYGPYGEIEAADIRIDLAPGKPQT